jgi:ribose 1,5-bisphosphokinase
VCSEGRDPPRDRRLGSGLAVLIVGASAVGKDAIINQLRGSLAADRRFFFPRRIVTRQANQAEDHLCVAPETFETLLSQGAMALHWEAHGLRYGIGAEIDLAIRDGSTVVFNASRSQIHSARKRYRNTAVVLIEAPVALRLERLRLRQREPVEDIAARLERIASPISTADADLVICNDGPLQQAVDALTGWLQRRGE